MSLVTRLKPAIDNWNRPFRGACNERGKCFFSPVGGKIGRRMEVRFIDGPGEFMRPQFGQAA